MHKNKNLFIVFFLLVFSAGTLLSLSGAEAQTQGLQYTLLEKVPGTDGLGSDLPGYVKAIYGVALIIVVLSAVLMLSIGGFMYLTSAGNTSAMGTAKGVIFDALIGLAIALTAWLILNVINPDLVTVTLNGLSPIAVQKTTPLGPGGVPVLSTACTDPTALKTSLASGKSACTGGCHKQKCSFTQTVEAAIQNNSSGIDTKIIKAIICQESNGNPTAHSFDGGCGLMQITNAAWTSACPASILDPAENIRQGVALYKSKLSSVSTQSYGGAITPQQMTFAAYNCCGGGENPNSMSNSCKTADGWPALPKWACPIDPGTGTFNMCAVKNYACDVAACASQY